MENDSAAVRFSSDVWKWYKKLSDKTKVECILCQKKIGGTTNFRNHLMSKHPLTYKPKTKKAKDPLQAVFHKHKLSSTRQ